MDFKAILCNFWIEAVLRPTYGTNQFYSGDYITYPWNIKLYRGQDLSITETVFTGGICGVTVRCKHPVVSNVLTKP